MFGLLSQLDVSHHHSNSLSKLGLTDDPTCERCLEDESVTRPAWLWGYSSFEISSPGPILHGTKWLPPEVLHFIRSVGLIKAHPTHKRARTDIYIQFPLYLTSLAFPALLDSNLMAKYLNFFMRILWHIHYEYPLPIHGAGITLSVMWWPGQLRNWGSIPGRCQRFFCSS
jgi:hypothetical protein